MDERPRVSVVIPHYNDLRRLSLCLDSLGRQTYQADRVEIVVADNASPQGLDAVRAAVGKRARVVLVEDKGAGPARNGGVAATTGQILAFIDSDCQAEPAWLENGVEALKRHDLIGGKVVVLVEDPARVTPVEAFERVFAFNFKDYINRKGFTGAGNLLCPRSLFEAVGGFKSGLSEDVEWSRRAVAMGFRLGYAPKAVVGHPARRSWEELLIKWRKANSEAYALAAGRRGRRLRWIVYALALPLSAVAHVPRVVFSPELEGTRQRLDALKVLFAIRFWRLGDTLALVAGRAGR